MAAVGQERGRGDEGRRGGDDDDRGKRLPGLEVGIVVGEAAGEEEEVQYTVHLAGHPPAQKYAVVPRRARV